MFTRAWSKDLHARGLYDSGCGTGVGIEIGASVIHFCWSSFADHAP
jgi:hypothetical protein